MNNIKVCCENCAYWVKNPPIERYHPTKSFTAMGNYKEAHDGICHYEPQATITVKEYWCRRFQKLSMNDDE